MDNQDAIHRLQDLLQRKAIIKAADFFGDNERKFTLASGRQSEYYSDSKRAILNAAGLQLVGELMSERLQSYPDVEGVGGLAVGAVPIAAAISLASIHSGRELPMFWARGDAKSHGTEDSISQAFIDDGQLVQAGRHLAIVDDVLTTGGSIKKAIEAVQAVGAIIDVILVLVDRKEGAEDLRESFKVEALFESDEHGNLSPSEAARKLIYA